MYTCNRELPVHPVVRAPNLDLWFNYVNCSVVSNIETIHGFPQMSEFILKPIKFENWCETGGTEVKWSVIEEEDEKKRWHVRAHELDKNT